MRTTRGLPKVWLDGSIIVSFSNPSNNSGFDKQLKEEGKDSFEANTVKDQFKNLEKALNEVEKIMFGLKRGEL